MTYRANPDDQGWVTCRERLLETIAKWQKRPKAVGVAIECPAAPRYSTRFTDAADRAVSVTFSAGEHVDRTVTVSRFVRPVDNLWALALGLDAVRLNELRGLDDVARQVYQALPAPRTRDPWEVLGLRPDADPEAIEAVYRSKARRAHPDTGGDAAAFRELQAAYEEVKR
jgi:hypothetical protein